MEPLSLATAFAAVVGLLGQFQAERTARSENEYQEFVEWLTARRHNSVVEALGDNHLLASSIQQLLSENHETVVQKLDNLAALSLSVASSIAEFRELSKSQGYHAADRMLFDKFMVKFHSDSEAMLLLQNHDFQNTYKFVAVSPINEFIETWTTADYRFVDANLEAAKQRLIVSWQSFSHAEAVATGAATSPGWMTLIPDQYKVDYNIPDFVLSKIRNVNQLASDAFSEHQEFIFICRSTLLID